MKHLLIIAVVLAFVMTSQAKPKKKGKADHVAQKLFETNCLACHDPIKMIAGPTLHEIHKIYQGNPTGIVTWAKKPGRKRTEGIAMPAMAHIADADLKLIADYMLYAGSKVSRKALRANNIFKEELARTQRSFMPDSSVVSFALRYNDDLSVCWDAEKGMTRYIWKGKIDPLSHFTGNGKVIPAIVGDIISKSSQQPFSGLEGKIIFQGYKINSDGLPTFFYQRGSVKIHETHSGENGNISWSYKVSGLSSLTYQLPKVQGYKVSCDKGKNDNGLVLLNKNELNNFTINLTKEN